MANFESESTEEPLFVPSSWTMLGTKGGGDTIEGIVEDAITATPPGYLQEFSEVYDAARIPTGIQNNEPGEGEVVEDKKE